eukprot:jgi/Mesvir1/14815/Mv05448-RA.1
MAEPSGRSHSGMGSNAEGDVVMCGCSPDARPGHHAIATLADWAHANGAHWQAETLECRFLDENYGYGIVAKADIPAGTTVLSIPRHLMVTSHAARQHKTGRAIEAAGLSSAVSGVECLYLYLISLRYDTEDASVGPHAPYVHALPSSFTCPIWLCERECEQWLPGTEADSQVRAIRAKLRASYDKLARLLLPTAPAVFKPAWYTWRNYLWAYCAYTSRCFPATLLRPQVPRPVRGSGREATELLPMQGEGAATKGSALAGRESVDLAADVAADAAGHGAPSHGEEAAGQVPWEAPVREAVPSSGTQAGFLAKGHGHGQTGGARRSYHGGGHLGGQEDGDAVDGSFGMPGVKLPGGADEEEEGSEVDGWDAPGMLIPFLDMANHMDRTPVSWVLDGDSVALRVEADQVVGCQLFNNYGSKRSVSTMLTYGFCDPENPWDSVHIRLGLPVATDDLASVRSMLRRTLGIRHSQYLSMPAGLGAAVAADRAAAAMTSAMDVAFKAGDDVAVTADGDDGVKAGGGVAATAGGGASLTAGRDPCRPPYRVPRELLASLLISLGDEATLYRLTHSWAHDAPCTVKSSDKPSGTSADTSARAAQVLQAAGPLVHLRLLQLLYTHLATLLNALGGGHDGADARRCREAIVGGARGSREGTGGEDIVETSGGCPTRGGSDAKKLPTKEARRGDVSEGMYGTVGCSMATSGEPSGGRKAVCGAENGGKNEEVSERGCGRQRVTGYSCGAALMGSYRESQRRVLVGGLASTLEEMGDLMRGLGAGVGEVTGPGVAAPLRLKSEGSCCAASASISSRVARWQRWVLAQGGTCHIDLHPTRGWTASLPLAAGTPLMSIPSNLILTAPAVTAADPELRQVASAMHASLQSRAGPETATGAATTAGGGRDVGRGGRGRGEDEEEDADGCAIRCVRDEVVLALYLCQHVDLCAGSATAAASGMASQGNRSSECVDPADGTDLGVGGANGPPGGMCPWQPFLDALLPESEGSALLWSQGELARLGPGSPAHSRVCQQREELANEYRQLVLPCMRAFPSFFSPPARFSFQRFLWASAACEARRVLLPCDQVQGKRGAPPFDAGHKRSSCSVPSVPGLMGSPGRGVTSLTGGSVPDATVGDVSSDAGALRPASSVTGGNEEARARGTDALGQEAPPWVGVLPIPWVPRPSLQGAFFPSFRSYPRPGCLVDGSASAAGAPAGSTCDRGGVYASSADGQVHAHEPDSPTCSGRVHRGGQTLGGQHQERASRDPPGGQAADKECSGPALGEREQPRSETCADVSRDACWGMRGVDGTAGWQEGSQNRHARAAPAGSVYVLTAVCDVAAGADVRGTLAPGSSLVGVDNTELLLRTGEALEGNPLEGVEVELGPELLAGEWDDACGDDEGEEGRDGEEVDEEEGGGGGQEVPQGSQGARGRVELVGIPRSVMMMSAMTMERPRSPGRVMGVRTSRENEGEEPAGRVGRRRRPWVRGWGKVVASPQTNPKTRTNLKTRTNPKGRAAGLSGDGARGSTRWPT